MLKMRPFPWLFLFLLFLVCFFKDSSFAWSECPPLSSSEWSEIFAGEVDAPAREPAPDQASLESLVRDSLQQVHKKMNDVVRRCAELDPTYGPGNKKYQEQLALIQKEQKLLLRLLLRSSAALMQLSPEVLDATHRNLVSRMKDKVYEKSSVTAGAAGLAAAVLEQMVVNGYIGLANEAGLLFAVTVGTVVAVMGPKRVTHWAHQRRDRIRSRQGIDLAVNMLMNEEIFEPGMFSNLSQLLGVDPEKLSKEFVKMIDAYAAKNWPYARSVDRRQTLAHCSTYLQTAIFSNFSRTGE